MRAGTPLRGRFKKPEAVVTAIAQKRAELTRSVIVVDDEPLDLGFVTVAERAPVLLGGSGGFDDLRGGVVLPLHP